MSPVAVRFGPIAAFAFVKIVYFEESPLCDQKLICVLLGLVQHVRFGVRLAFARAPVNVNCWFKIVEEPQRFVYRCV